MSGLGVAMRSTWYITAELQDGTRENVFIEFLNEVYAANQPSQRLGGGQRAQPASGLMKGNGAKSVKTASLRKSIGNKTRKNDSAAGPG